MAKGILLTVGAYVITLAAAAFALLVLMTVMDPRGCSDLSQALLVLWATIAALFLTSVVVVAVATWKTVPRRAGRFVILAGYGMLLLGSYLVIAFGLMVAFNC